MPTTTRKTAEERREQVLDAALDVFADHGLSGASTDEIARRAGISQPYLFRLFRTKKELFLASMERCFGETRETFERAAEGKSGEEALEAMGNAYVDLIQSNPSRLRGQLQAYAACDDPQIRAAVRKGYGEIVEAVERASGVDAGQLSIFFARGMLLNVAAAMELLDADEPWARKLLEFCAE
ncbi:MAG TPA: TetR/AcrR family transcriptional regulator [Gaiellaceae bacterium]|nr:TetR/AcrR family transcriptional regulator [Gaiellaceae bacterium]